MVATFLTILRIILEQSFTAQPYDFDVLIGRAEHQVLHIGVLLIEKIRLREKLGKLRRIFILGRL